MGQRYAPPSSRHVGLMLAVFRVRCRRCGLREWSTSAPSQCPACGLSGWKSTGEPWYEVAPVAGPVRDGRHVMNLPQDSA